MIVITGVPLHLHATYLWFIIVSCEHWKEDSVLETTGFLCVNDNLRGWDPHYAVRAMVDGDLLVLNWSPTESVAR